MYVCMHVCITFTVKLKYPCCCFAEAPALIPLKCSLNVDVEVELTHGTRLGMYGKALYNKLRPPPTIFICTLMNKSPFQAHDFIQYL